MKLNIDLKLVERLLRAIVNQGEQKDLNRFTDDMLDRGEPFQYRPLTQESNDLTLILNGDGLINSEEVSESVDLAALGGAFSANGFTVHLNVDGVYNSTYVSTHGEDVDESNWHAVIADNEDPDTFISISLGGIGSGHNHRVGDLEITIHPDLSLLEKEKLLTTKAGLALTDAFTSGNNWQASRTLGNLTSPLINKDQVLLESRPSISTELATLFIALRRLDDRPPALPITVTDLRWIIDGSKTLILVNQLDGAHVYATYENDLLLSPDNVFPPSVMNAVKEAYLYAQVRFHEKGELTGELKRQLIEPASTTTYPQGSLSMANPNIDITQNPVHQRFHRETR